MDYYTSQAVLLSVRSAVKERLGRSAAEMIYGTTLRLPGEFTEQYTIDTHTDLLQIITQINYIFAKNRNCTTFDSPLRWTL